MVSVISVLDISSNSSSSKLSKGTMPLSSMNVSPAHLQITQNNSSKHRAISRRVLLYILNTSAIVCNGSISNGKQVSLPEMFNSFRQAQVVANLARPADVTLLPPHYKQQHEENY